MVNDNTDRLDALLACQQLEQRLVSLQDHGVDISALHMQLSFVHDLIDQGRYEDAALLRTDVINEIEDIANGKRPAPPPADHDAPATSTSMYTSSFDIPAPAAAPSTAETSARFTPPEPLLEDELKQPIEPLTATSGESSSVDGIDQLAEMSVKDSDVSFAASSHGSSQASSQASAQESSEAETSTYTPP